jgi:hypothetical protein
VPTLTIAVNAPSAGAEVKPGAVVRIGFVEGTDITAAGRLELGDIAVPSLLEGEARVLVPTRYRDRLQATATGDVSVLIYPTRAGSYPAQWVEANPTRVWCAAHRRVHGDCDVRLSCSIRADGKSKRDRRRNHAHDPAEFPSWIKMIIDNRRMEPGSR